jgi:serine/threonine protein kinase
LVKKLNTTSKEIFALKFINLNVEKKEESLKEATRELLFGFKDCKYLVQYKDYFFIQENMTSGVCIRMEYFKNGDFKHYVFKRFKEESVFSTLVSYFLNTN